MKARTPQETANEQTIRKLYSLAEARRQGHPGIRDPRQLRGALKCLKDLGIWLPGLGPRGPLSH
jgi:hypothetical protein